MFLVIFGNFWQNFQIPLVQLIPNCTRQLTHDYLYLLTSTGSSISVQGKAGRTTACVATLRISTSWFVFTFVLICFAFVDI